MLAIKALFWLSLGALLWTHLLYPLAAWALVVLGLALAAPLTASAVGTGASTARASC